MYTERFSLPFLSGVLIAAAERRRPGLGAWSEAGKAQLLQVFREELASARAAFLEMFKEPEAWAWIERALVENCFPRYAVLAEKQTTLEQREYGLWRGGDIVARSAFFGIGLGLGLFLVKAPFIPIPETWDLLILALGFGGPFVPDLQVWLAKRRYAKALQAVVEDMREAQQARQLYEPLDSEGMLAPISEVVSEPVHAEPTAASGERTGEKS
jgi:hypothetical protein